MVKTTIISIFYNSSKIGSFFTSYSKSNIRMSHSFSIINCKRLIIRSVASERLMFSLESAQISMRLNTSGYFCCMYLGGECSKPYVIIGQGAFTDNSN